MSIVNLRQKVAAADSDKSMSAVKGEQESGRAKASQLQGQLEMALNNNRNSHQQKHNVQGSVCC